MAARGLAAAREAGGVGVLTGGRLTAEDSYAYAKFARVALGTNDIDFRARAHSAEEADFLAAHVVLTGPAGGAVTYDDLEAARSVVLVGFEPEDEAGTVFLRLRKAAPRSAAADLLDRAVHLPWPAQDVRHADPDPRPARSRPRSRPWPTTGPSPSTAAALILVGERMAAVPGALAAVSKLAMTTGARVAWIPRRAGDRGAVETGALPTLLPGGRPVADAGARVDLAAAWGVEHLPETPGRDGDAIVAAAAAGELGGLVVGGVDPADLPDPALARQAVEQAGFVVALEVRHSEVTAAADVVFPVAPVTDRSGTFVNWEGRVRQFGKVLHNPSSLPDLRVLAGIAEELGAGLGFRTSEQVWAEMTEVGPWDGERATSVEARVSTSSTGGADGALTLASWKQLIDDGRMQDGDDEMRQTARKPVVLVGRGPRSRPWARRSASRSR